MMIRFVLILMMVGMSPISQADAIYDLCMSKDTHIDLQVFFSVMLKDPTLPSGKFSKVGEKESCLKMAERAKVVEYVSFDHPIKDLDFLDHFPKATMMDVTVDGLKGGINIGNRPQLEKIHLDGHFIVTEPGELANSKDLKVLALVGRKKGGFVDLKEFAAFDKLKRLSLIGIQVKNAQAIDQLTSLSSIIISNCTLDSKVDFSKHSPELVKLIFNVKYPSENSKR